MRLERVAPVQEPLHPVAALAVAAVGRSIRTHVKIMRRLVPRILQVGCFGPQDVDTHAHARRDEVPQIPLVEPNRGAVKVAAVERCRAGYARAAITTHRQVGALKVVAEQDRSSCRRRPGQPALGAPQKQIVTDQEYIGFLLASAIRYDAVNAGAPILGSLPIDTSTVRYTGRRSTPYRDPVGSSGRRQSSWRRC